MTVVNSVRVVTSWTLRDGQARSFAGVSRNMNITRGQAVYVLSTPSGFYKVGIAKNTRQRRAELQCGCPEPIAFELDTCIRDDGVDPRDFERLMHEALAPWRTSGEWFKPPHPRIIARVMKETWVRLRCPALHQRWDRFRLHVAAMRWVRSDERLYQPTELARAA
jgi:hypothetical protein